MCRGLLNYTYADGSIDILPLLKRIIQNHIPVWVFSGDEDSVVLLLGSRTLVRELAHDMQFKITVPYGAWFQKGQDPSKFVVAVVRSATADSGAAPASAAAEEKKEEPAEESDDDMGFSLFD
ncbi:hypothetical protein POM88_050531 [Heracleum sosnowskyi]|uniref:60S acidic ribosomal protein P0 n=1 Tax=Heracleum sosnowskyi TaxID=360622 RepID=A0AAD8GXS1_9APIA|nr:hypothetical protein POM88_050531 [Heracleum sosnowskyi]